MAIQAPHNPNFGISKIFKTILPIPPEIAEINVKLDFLVAVKIAPIKADILEKRVPKVISGINFHAS